MALLLRKYLPLIEGSLFAEIWEKYFACITLFNLHKALQEATPSSPLLKVRFRPKSELLQLTAWTPHFWHGACPWCCAIVLHNYNLCEQDPAGTLGRWGHFRREASEWVTVIAVHTMLQVWVSELSRTTCPACLVTPGDIQHRDARFMNEVTVLTDGTRAFITKAYILPNAPCVSLQILLFLEHPPE